MTTVNKDGKLITPIIRKYIDIIRTGIIQENEIIAMKSLINKNDDARRILFDELQEGELSLSDEQTAKGYDFLIDQWKTPRGIERKNNPFGYREQNALENFSHFTLSDFYDAGNIHHSYYLPIYNVYTKDGYGFQYYYNGKVNIIG
jgi:hypothetical protein